MQIFKPTPNASKKVVYTLSLSLILSPVYAKQVTTVPTDPPIIVESPTIDLGLEEEVIDTSAQPDTTPITLIQYNPDEEVEEEDIEPLAEDLIINDDAAGESLDKSTEEKSTTKEEPASKDKPGSNKKNTKPDEKKVDKKNGFVHKDIELPGIENELTQKYITYYQGAEGRKLLAQALKNSVPYRPYILQSLEKNSLPLYLQYLPVIESNYKPTAVSRSGATGIWQFMTNSMAPLMKKGKWFDDRRDPWISTDAAMLKFKDNYKFFGDWTMAIAAYNCGAGALLKIKNANPGDDYWKLCEKGLLKNETVHYIPKFLAVIEIVENAGYYGLDDIKKAAELTNGKVPEEFDYVPTRAMLTFHQLSEVTGVSVEKIRQLNMGLFKDCTPLGENYKLRLPKGSSKGIKEKLRKKGLATDSQLHTVVKGDTLWGISRKYEITVADLCKANGIDENSVLSIGKQLVVPIF